MFAGAYVYPMTSDLFTAIDHDDSGDIDLDEILDWQIL